MTQFRILDTMSQRVSLKRLENCILRNEGIHFIPLISWTEISQSDNLESYPGNPFGGAFSLYQG